MVIGIAGNGGIPVLGKERSVGRALKAFADQDNLPTIFRSPDEASCGLDYQLHAGTNIGPEKTFAVVQLIIMLAAQFGVTTHGRKGRADDAQRMQHAFPKIDAFTHQASGNGEKKSTRLVGKVAELPAKFIVCTPTFLTNKGG